LSNAMPTGSCKPETTLEIVAGRTISGVAAGDIDDDDAWHPASTTVKATNGKDRAARA
jgi:hypothetical protein